jgi:thiol:disulfide interchange protein DsbD
VLYFAYLEVYSLNSMMRFIIIILLSLNLYSNSSTLDFLNKESGVLPAIKAFNLETVISDEAVLISWDIKEGYYLYFESIKIENTNETFKFEILKSEEYIHKDEFFGESRILRNKALIKLNNMTGLDLNNILIKYQGCADIGICYPIQIHKLL